MNTLTLTGANTYSGKTTINAGTLQIGDGDAASLNTSKVTFAKESGALLAFNHNNDMTFDGEISGDGSLTKAGESILTLTGDSDYTGGTTINAGTLQIGNGGTAGKITGNVEVNSDSTLAFNRSDAVIFGGDISGAGIIVQNGTGTLSLTGNNAAYAGITEVGHGILTVNSQLGGTLLVQAAGRLQGSGTVGDTIVHGTVAPGNSIGTLHVAGDFAFEPGSVYEVEVDAAGNSDRIIATGTATIDHGASVRVLAGAGHYAAHTQYTILSAAGGLNGTFSGATSNLAFLDPSLGYGANQVLLTMTRNDASFASVGLTRNQIATGGGVESLGTGPIFDAVLNLSADQARAAFDRLSGEIHASMRTALLEDSHFIRDAANHRLRAAQAAPGSASGGVLLAAQGDVPGLLPPVAANPAGPAFWTQGFGSWGATHGNGNAARLERDSDGLIAGVDWPLGRGRVGVMAGYSDSNAKAAERASSGSSHNYHLGVYGGAAWGGLALRTGAAYTRHYVKTRRDASFPGLTDHLSGAYQAEAWQAFGELGYDMAVGGSRIEPFINLAHTRLRSDRYTEQGDAAALIIGQKKSNVSFATLGVRAATGITLGGAELTVKGLLGWRHAFGDVEPHSTQRFAGGGDAFLIGGTPIARNAALIEAGLDYVAKSNTTLSLSYGGQFGSGVADHAIKASLNIRF
ncbi:autotransporter outer membrane beta-barrel domain-containing protein [Castellaniella sp. WN]